MGSRESLHIIAAILILTIVVSFSTLLKGNYTQIPQLLLFSVIVILIPIIAKKLMASHLDANVEHEILTWKSFGFRPHQKLKKALPIGIILPLFFTIFSLGFVKLMTLLTYEPKALKRRAARRHGYYSFTEMTDWHNALIGASGIATLLVIAIIAYFLPYQGLETLAKISAYYAFWNMVPLFKLDGTQIFFGSRPLYFLLGALTLIATAFALLII